MLIITTVENMPEGFRCIAQNMQTYEVCGYTDQEGFEVVEDIPPGFAQRMLPGHYGEFLTVDEIENYIRFREHFEDVHDFTLGLLGIVLPDPEEERPPPEELEEEG